MDDPLPKHTADQVAKLRAEIAAAGEVQVRVIVAVFPNGTMRTLDGILRLRLAEELGVPCPSDLIEVTNEADYLHRRITANARYRVLTTKQKEEYLKSLWEHYPAYSARWISRMVQVSKNTAERHRPRPRPEKVKGPDGKRYPARRIPVANTTEADRVATNLKRTGGFAAYSPRHPLTPKTVSRKADKADRSDWLTRHERTPPLPASDYRLLCGDSRKVMAQAVKSGTVALVCTDPLWTSGRADDWRWLGRWAMEALMPGGYLVAVCGSCWLLDYSAAVLGSGLTYYHLGAFVFPTGLRKSTGRTTTNERIRHVLIAHKGKRRPHRRFDDVYVLGLGEREPKRWHQFQQPLPAVAHFVTFLSSPGELVADPFAGSFTTAVACAMLRRKFVGCDLDQRNVDNGWARIREVKFLNATARRKR